MFYTNLPAYTLQISMKWNITSFTEYISKFYGLMSHCIFIIMAFYLNLLSYMILLEHSSWFVYHGETGNRFFPGRDYWYSNSPIYRVPRYTAPVLVPPISCFTIEHDVLTFPRFTVPPIYRAFLLCPEKHGKSGDYCITIIKPLMKLCKYVFHVNITWHTLFFST